MCEQGLSVRYTQPMYFQCIEVELTDFTGVRKKLENIE